MTRKIALVGIGKIARDQHIPSIANSDHFELAATASRNASVAELPAYSDLTSLLNAHPDIPCVSLCTPPQARYDDARLALEAGRHVMLEKPPGATLSEVHNLIDLANKNNVTLYATWHSRHAVAVAAARDWLKGKTITKIEIIWKEDVRRWHPNQDWIWEAGGLGVFDPGINALSVLTAILPEPVHLKSADLAFPANRDTPIAADLEFHAPSGAKVTAAFDWRQEGPQTWDISLSTSDGNAKLTDGGSTFNSKGREISGPDIEYPSLYSEFHRLLDEKNSEVDLSPMRHVADAFTLGKRAIVDAFDW